MNSPKFLFSKNTFLTYGDVYNILHELDESYRIEIAEINSESIVPYKVARGKMLALKDILACLEDFGNKKQKQEDMDFVPEEV